MISMICSLTPHIHCLYEKYILYVLELRQEVKVKKCKEPHLLFTAYKEFLSDKRF